MNVMAPTMQVACKAFIVPNPAARSPKERYTQVPCRFRKRGDEQDWDALHLLELLPKCDILVANFTYFLAYGHS